MGFSLMFMRFREGEVVDGDREGARRFLDARGLRVDPEEDLPPAHLVDADGARLSFDGQPTDLHLQPLDTPRTFNGGIWHASLTSEECQFVFDLCVACGFLVCNDQGGTAGSPMFVVPRGTHRVEDVAPLESTGNYGFVDTADGLRAALDGGFERFAAYRDQALRTDPD